MILNQNTFITDRFRLNPLQLKGLERLGLKTLSDLLRYFPARYGTSGQAKKIAELTKGENVIIYAKVLKNETKKAFRKRIPMAEALVEDETGRLKVVWFHQAYLAKKAPAGQTVYLNGKVAERRGSLYLVNPEISAGSEPFRLAAGSSLFTTASEESLLPVYSETRGLSSNWFYHHIKTLLETGVHESLTEPLPESLLQAYHLPRLATALVWIHNPKKESNVAAARKRFAFEEIFLIQLSRLQDRLAYQATGAAQIDISPRIIEEFLDCLPFKPTPAQRRALNQILADFKKGPPMTRLLEGDVGSGKTAVAAAAAYAAAQAGYETAYMAPTEILAKQHFENFIRYFAKRAINIGLITSSGCYKFPSKINRSSFTPIARNQLLKWVANGEIPILIGTQALIQKKVKWKSLGLVIIDEQHRFGVMQRAQLIAKNQAFAPHLLSMTATPIPRTLALTIYSDLDLSLLDELPAGRKPIITTIVPPSEIERHKVYDKLRQALAAGRQAYVICPRIDLPDPGQTASLQAKSAKAEQRRLGEKIFPEYVVGLLHSKMRPREKDEVMQDFERGHIHILVATSVVEVGVNVPNATVILIEGAERFGLAQLHQLRGRVLRSSHQAYCYLFTETKNAKARERLTALSRAKNGFELAELDLALRGTGPLSGEKQWGISDLGMEAIKNLKMVEAARQSAQALIKSDPDLAHHPAIKKALASRARAFHFE